MGNKAKGSADNVIRAGDLLRGVLRTLPDTLKVNGGLLNLALARAERSQSIGRRFEQLAQRQPQHPAVQCGDRRWSYAEFNAWANQIAAVLRAQGVRHGDAVGILIENRAEALACVLATVKLGAIAGMLNHQQRGDVLAHSLKLTRAKLLIAGEECMAALDDPAIDLHGKGLLWDGNGSAPQGWMNLRELTAAASADNPPETAAVKMKDPCFYIFTSGTTGLPKASVMTHYRWWRGMAGMGQMTLRLDRDDVLYCCLPIYHNNALTVSWGAVLGGGATLALGRKFSATRFWDDIRRTRATAFCYIGELCRYLLNQPSSATDRDNGVRVIVGNGLRAEIWEDFQNRFGIERVCEFYGASESNVAFANGFDVARTAGFCPLPFAVVAFDADAETPVRDARGFMRKVAVGEVGLLISEITTSAPFDGYTDAKATQSKLLANVFKRGDSWFNTGDLVLNQGYRHIQFVDRIGDTFRWKGENVATTEVEAAIERCAGVAQAIVYGVQIPQADGRAGMAALTLHEPLADTQLTALATQLTAALPAYAVPVFLRLAEAELTSTFKVRKGPLKEQGFDPARVDGPVYVLLDRQRGYERLTPDIWVRIQQGGVKL